MYKIKNFRLFDKIRLWLNLSDLDYQEVLLSNVVTPVFDVSPRIDYGGLSTSKDISTADQVVYTIPSGYVGRIKYVYRGASLGSTYFYVSPTTAASNVGRLSPSGTGAGASNPDVLITQGMSIMLATSGNGGDTAVTASVCLEIQPMYLTSAAVNSVTGEYSR